MMNTDQTATQTVSTVKQDWVKPEITAFAAAVDAQGGMSSVNDDANVVNRS